MAKSADAFRTISEVSTILDTPTHVLRFWESRFAQIKPVKRAGGRRYYRPEDILLLGGIKRLLHEDGMAIRGVQKLLKDEGVRHVMSLATIDLSAAEQEATVDATPEAAPWPAAPEPEPEAPAAQFPPDPQDPVPAAPPSKASWRQPSFFDEPAPEAPMALDVEPEATPGAEIVELATARGAPNPPAPPEADPTPPMSQRLRALSGTQLSEAERDTLKAAKSRLVALRSRLAAATLGRAE
ncbi:MerR family transcriptional regulator [Sedimentimonas flavescens]|uniref:MerR family transcriptional regulator n=1 Tax=Sedimentimonas flavescens TaxID=2851012 RepID=A0ABT2ZYB1_9RHOB|nr:MerR family transcriptional regulator [Sedimentimonas flavescens]MCV2878727.1 MerR family transcriptional regulator [Sedimentimonas flavescens]